MDGSRSKSLSTYVHSWFMCKIIANLGSKQKIISTLLKLQFILGLLKLVWAIIFAYFRNYKQRFECLKINDYWKKISHLHTYLIAQVVLYIIQTSAINMMNIYVYWLIQFKSGSPLDGVSLKFLPEFTTKFSLKVWKQLPWKISHIGTYRDKLCTSTSGLWACGMDLW